MRRRNTWRRAPLAITPGELLATLTALAITVSVSASTLAIWWLS